MASTGQQIEDDRISRISIASKAVATIPKSHLDETKSFARPPKAVIDVLEAVAILLGYKGDELGWKNLQKLMGNSTYFLKSIEDIDYEKITEDSRTKASQKVSGYSRDSITKNSKAATIFYDWVEAVVKE